MLYPANMSLTQWCTAIGANLRIDWDRKKKKWRVCIAGGYYKLVSHMQGDAEGKTITLTYHASHYQPVLVYDDFIDVGMNKFVNLIRGAKIRLHGKVMIVPIDMGVPIIGSMKIVSLQPHPPVEGPFIKFNASAHGFIEGMKKAGYALNKLPVLHPAPTITHFDKAKAPHDDIIGNGPSPDFVNFVKGLSKPKGEAPVTQVSFSSPEKMTYHQFFEAAKELEDKKASELASELADSFKITWPPEKVPFKVSVGQKMKKILEKEKVKLPKPQKVDPFF